MFTSKILYLYETNHKNCHGSRATLRKQKGGACDLFSLSHTQDNNISFLSAIHLVRYKFWVFGIQSNDFHRQIVFFSCITRLTEYLFILLVSLENEASKTQHHETCGKLTMT